jgi:uncharacterized Zn finger protein (UPF0148 family)
VHCPRCGTPNEAGDRFCSSCGAALQAPKDPKERISIRERAVRIVGTTRKARLITAATAIALTVAIAAFIALKPSEDTIPRDGYTIAADQLCLEAKGDIVAAERRAAAKGTSAFAEELVPIVASWRSRFEALAVPSDRTEQAQQLEGALLEAEAKIGGLARVAATGDRAEILASAKRSDAASAGVEAAVASLGLSECASATIGLSGETR